MCRKHWGYNRELSRSINFCIQFICQKGSTFLAIVTPSYRFAPLRLPKRSFIFLKGVLIFFKSCIPAFCTIARMSLFLGQCERLSRRLVTYEMFSYRLNFCNEPVVRRFALRSGARCIGFGFLQRSHCNVNINRSNFRFNA